MTRLGGGTARASAARCPTQIALAQRAQGAGCIRASVPIQQDRNPTCEGGGGSWNKARWWRGQANRGQHQTTCVWEVVMFVWSPRPRAGRPRLGSPVVPINPTAAYLRHRAAVARAHRARQRALWRCRLLALAACTLFYLGIGRDIIQVARAKKDALVMEARADVHQATSDVERIVQSSRSQDAGEIISPVAFTSAAALASREDPSDVDAWLSEDPVEVRSRVQ